MNLGHINFHRLTDSDLASIWAAIETQPARPEALEMIDAPPRCTMKGLLKRLAQAEPQHEAKAPLVVSCGIGVDSVAMLVGLWRRGIRPDLILFADPGSEWPETYLYVLVLAAWLAEVGFPPLTIVRRDQGRTSYTTLEGNCLVNRTLPSMAFGYGGCSQKWKREPMDKLVGRWLPALRALRAGVKTQRAIGYDADPKDCRRGNIKDCARYHYVYFLREWGWDRDRCEAEIIAAGLPLPRKSACFFCPAMKAWELRDLVRLHPGLADRVIGIEAGAAKALIKVEGLWRKATKEKPGSMTAFINAERAK